MASGRNPQYLCTTRTSVSFSTSHSNTHTYAAFYHLKLHHFTVFSYAHVAQFWGIQGVSVIRVQIPWGDSLVHTMKKNRMGRGSILNNPRDTGFLQNFEIK